MSPNNDINLAMDTLDKLFALGIGQGVLFHSDQGCLYTAYPWRDRLAQNGIIQSKAAEGVVGIMRAWNTFLGRSRLKAATMTYCVQTRFCRTPPAILRAIAPFAMQKAGSVGYADTTCTSVAKYNETKALIVDFIEYYNNERISASLGWKTPAQAVA